MRIVTFGEIMLRLKSPGKERFFQSQVLDATFGGAEANVAVAIACLGEEAVFVTAVPDNLIGKGCITELRRQGVDVSYILKEGSRLGIYYLEEGAGQRPTVVTYDREGSSVSQIPPEKYDWEKAFKGATHFHISGITPAISSIGAEVSLYAMKKAREKSLKISIDLNYRSKLWKYGKTAIEVMSELIKYADIAIGNEEDFQKSLGIVPDNSFSVEQIEFDENHYRHITDTVLETYPNLEKIAITLRQSKSVDNNIWSAVLNNRKDYISSLHYEINNIVDRIGSGDAFAASLLFAIEKYKNDKTALDFAVAAGCLKHSISGDFPISTENEIFSLLKGGGSRRIQR